MEYVDTLGEEEQLFKFKPNRAWQIVSSILGIPDHWLRAYGEKYLYLLWDKDIVAVSQYVEVDPRTLQHYLVKEYDKYLDERL